MNQNAIRGDALAAESLPDLLVAGARGCDKSFAAVCVATRGHLRNVLVRLLGPSSEVDDLLQEVYVKAWLNVEQFSLARGTVHAWMSAIARNVALDSFRRRKTRPWCVSASDDDNVLPFENTPCPQPSQSTLADNAQTSMAVHRCVEGLSPKRRALIMQAFFEDLSHSEISERNGIPLGTVKSQIRRAVESMRTPLLAFATL